MGAFDDLLPGQTADQSKSGGAFSDLLPQKKQKSEYGRVAQEALGVAKGASDPFVGASQLVMRGLNLVGAVSDEALKTHEDYYNNLEQKYQEATPDGSGAGRVLGNIAVGAPLALTPAAGAGRALGTIAVGAPLALTPAAGAGLMARIGAGFGTGSISAALQPVNTSLGQDFTTEKAKQIAIGAIAGSAAPVIGKAISRVVSPQTDEAATRLLNEGVRLTPGQALGGAFKRAEEGATSIPILGDAIKSSQRRGIEDFNRVAVNRALAPIGKMVPQSEPVGYQLIDKAHQTVSKNYDELLPKLNPLQVDTKLDSQMSNLLQMSKNMHPDYAQQFDNIMQNEVFSKFTPSGTMSSTSMKEVESQLGKFARRFGRTEDGNAQMLGDALQEAQSTIRQAVERQNPHLSGELKKANLAWAELLRVENAAGRMGAKDGVFTPSQYEGATRALDSSLRKSQFSRGKALGQDFATAAESVLSSKLPDSGTPFRAMLAAGTVGAGALNPIIPIAAIGGAAFYSSPAQKALIALMTKRPDLAPQIAKHLELISASGGLLAPALINANNK